MQSTKETSKVSSSITVTKEHGLENSDINLSEKGSVNFLPLEQKKLENVNTNTKSKTDKESITVAENTALTFSHCDHSLLPDKNHLAEDEFYKIEDYLIKFGKIICVKQGGLYCLNKY